MRKLPEIEDSAFSIEEIDDIIERDIKENPVTSVERKLFAFAEFEDVRVDCNQYYGEPMSLTLEKISKSAVLYTPKCYGLHMALGSNKPFLVKASGLSCVRRGGCLLQRTMCKTVIDILLKENNPQKAIDYVRGIVFRVKTGKVKLHEVVMRSTLSKDPRGYTKASSPPHVEMALRMMAAGDAPLRAGDRVYYLISPRDTNAKVRDKVETPLNMAAKLLPYDKTYYLDVVMKEAKKVLRPVVDSRTWAEKFMFTETIRKLLDSPEGKTEVQRMKTKLKAHQDLEVESVVLHGLDIDFSARKPLSLYDLPEEYQGNLPPAVYHWAGNDPSEKIPTIAEHVPFSINSPCEAVSEDPESGSISTLLDSEGDLEDSDDDETDEISTHQIINRVEAELTYYGDLDYSAEQDLLGEIDGDEACGTCGTPGDDNAELSHNTAEAQKASVAKFCSMFRPEKKKPRIYNRQLASVGQSRIASVSGKNPISKFVVPMDPCLFCYAHTASTNLQVCEKCYAQDAQRGDMHREQIAADILKLIKKESLKAKKANDTCIACVRSSGIEATQTLIEKCCDFSCPIYYSRRKASAKLERATNKARSIQIEYELDEAGHASRAEPDSMDLADP
jgi:hypothetical protein